jgi:hypothetical protein
MESRNGLVTFGLFVLLFVFSIVFSMDAINAGNTTYGILALVGYVVCVGASIYNSKLAKHEGSALQAWFVIYAIVVGLVFIYFLTRLGSVFA